MFSHAFVQKRNEKRTKTENPFQFLIQQDDTTLPTTTNNSIDLGTTSYSASTQQMGVRVNVLNRVGHQQDKWKRQVREQRRNIYDRHTMLN